MGRYWAAGSEGIRPHSLPDALDCPLIPCRQATSCSCRGSPRARARCRTVRAAAAVSAPSAVFPRAATSRYPGPDGVVRPADDTFETKTEAETWLTRKEAEIIEDDWIDPDAGEVLLCDYGATWIEERPGLRPKTVTLYRYLRRSHIAPYFPAMTIARLKLAAVRRWRTKLLDSGE